VAADEHPAPAAEVADAGFATRVAVTSARVTQAAARSRFLRQWRTARAGTGRLVTWDGPS
jgi:hypothetical protein